AAADTRAGESALAAESAKGAKPALELARGRAAPLARARRARSRAHADGGLQLAGAHTRRDDDAEPVGRRFRARIADAVRSARKPRPLRAQSGSTGRARADRRSAAADEEPAARRRRRGALGARGVPDSGVLRIPAWR